EIVAALSALLDALELEFEDEPSVEEAVFIWKDSATEFTDCLINARHRALRCRATATFDVRAAELFGFVVAGPLIVAVGFQREEREARIAALRNALIEGEESGPSKPFDFEAFIARKRKQKEKRKAP